jgi:hypothetical protein
MRHVLAASIVLAGLTNQSAAPPSWHVTATVAESCSCTVSCPCNFGGEPSKNPCEGNRLIAIKAGHALSVQYHNKKDETVHLLSGELLYVDPWVFDTRFALRARMPRYTGAPGDSTCANAGCHTGTALNGGGGNVQLTSSAGTSYTPGQQQTLTITITDSSRISKQRTATIIAANLTFTKSPTAKVRLLISATRFVLSWLVQILRASFPTSLRFAASSSR